MHAVITGPLTDSDLIVRERQIELTRSYQIGFDPSTGDYPIYVRSWTLFEPTRQEPGVFKVSPPVRWTL